MSDDGVADKTTKAAEAAEAEAGSAKRRFHDDDGIPTPTSAAVIVIVVPFLVALAMFVGFYVYLMNR